MDLTCLICFVVNHVRCNSCTATYVEWSNGTKEKLILIIDLSLRKRLSWLHWIRLNYKFCEPKKKKHQKIIHDFIFITILSLGVLVGWVVAAVEGAVSLPLGSSLAGMGKVAKTNSMFWEPTPSLEEYLGMSEGLVISTTSSLGNSFTLFAWSACSTTSSGLWDWRGSLDKSSSIGFTTLGSTSSGEAKEPSARLQGGSTHFLLS